MRQKKVQVLTVEPTEQEVNEPTKQLCMILPNLLKEFRNNCNLSRRQAALLLGVDNKSLYRHEKNQDMLLSQFSRHIKTYMLYIEYNKIEKSSRLNKLMTEFFELLTK